MCVEGGVWGGGVEGGSRIYKGWGDLEVDEADSNVGMTGILLQNNN